MTGRPRPDGDWLAALCRLPGVSGDEGSVRAAVWERLRPLVDEAWVDPRGSLCARRAWARSGLRRLALCASLDEAGLIVAGIEPDGLLRFGLVGAVDPAALPGARVRVGPRGLPAAVVGPPPHVGGRLDPALLRLDAGARNRTEAAAEIRPGDRAAFLVPAGALGDLFRGKALHRAGLAVALAVLEAAPRDRPLALVCTAEDRVGASDAAAAARDLGAAAWLGLTAVEAGAPPRPVLGAGPVLAADGAAPARALLAAAGRLPIQRGLRPRHDAGPPGAEVAVPARYLRAPAGLLDPADLQAAADLVAAALEALWTGS